MQDPFIDACNESLKNLENIKNENQIKAELMRYIKKIKQDPEEEEDAKDIFNIDKEINRFTEQIKKLEKYVENKDFANITDNIDGDLLIQYYTATKTKQFYLILYKQYYQLWRFLKERLLQLYNKKIGDKYFKLVENKQQLLQSMLQLQKRWNNIYPEQDLAVVSQLEKRDFDYTFPKKGKFNRTEINQYINQYNEFVKQKYPIDNKINKIKQNYGIQIQNISSIKEQLKSKPVIFEEEESFSEEESLSEEM